MCAFVSLCVCVRRGGGGGGRKNFQKNYSILPKNLVFSPKDVSKPINVIFLRNVDFLNKIDFFFIKNRNRWQCCCRLQIK